MSDIDTSDTSIDYVSGLVLILSTTKTAWTSILFILYCELELKLN